MLPDEGPYYDNSSSEKHGGLVAPEGINTMGGDQKLRIPGVAEPPRESNIMIVIRSRGFALPLLLSSKATPGGGRLACRATNLAHQACRLS